MEFSKHAAVLEAEGHHVIKLNVGQPDFGAPPAVVNAMHEALDEAAPRIHSRSGSGRCGERSRVTMRPRTISRLIHIES